jgi:hypothetical protein
MPINKEALPKLPMETTSPQYTGISHLELPNHRPTIETDHGAGSTAPPSKNSKGPTAKEGGEGKKVQIAGKGWPEFIIETRYIQHNCFRAYVSRRMRMQFFDHFSDRTICGTSISMIDIPPLLEHVTKTSVQPTIETIMNGTGTSPSLYLPQKHVDVVIYQTLGGELKRMPQNWGWLAFEREVTRESERNIMVKKAEGLWMEELGLHQILSALGCGGYLLVTSSKGFYLARSNFTKIGFLSKRWGEAVQKITIIDNLEELLTDEADDDTLEKYYLMIEKIASSMRRELNQSEHYDFTDSSFGEMTLESAGDGDEEDCTEEEDWDLEGVLGAEFMIENLMDE